MQSQHLWLLATLCVQHLLPLFCPGTLHQREEVGEGNFETQLCLEVECSGALLEGVLGHFSHMNFWAERPTNDESSMHQLFCQDDYPRWRVSACWAGWWWWLFSTVVALVAWERAEKSHNSHCRISSPRQPVQFQPVSHPSCFSSKLARCFVCLFHLYVSSSQSHPVSMSVLLWVFNQVLFSLSLVS